MSYNESLSCRETAQLDDGVNQGNTGTCPEFLGDEELLYYNSQHFQEPPHACGLPLAQHHVPFGTASTLAFTCNDVSSNPNWDGVVGLCFAQNPLTPESDQTVDDSMFRDIFNFNWPVNIPTNTSTNTCVGDVNQSGYPYPLSPAPSTEDPLLQAISAWPPPTSSPKRSRRAQCKHKHCGKVFTKKNDLKRHYESVHSTHGPKYRCICGHARPRKDNHKRHVNNCNNTAKHPTYRCKCSVEHANQQIHLDHITQCKETFYGCAGRPRLNRVMTP